MFSCRVNGGLLHAHLLELNSLRTPWEAWLQEQGFTPGFIFFNSRSVGFHVHDASSDAITFDVGLQTAFNKHVHHILFPLVPFYWYDYRDQAYERLGIIGIRREALLELESLKWDMYLPPTSQAPMRRPTPVLDTLEESGQDALWAICEGLYGKWMNKKNDALGLYTHITQALYTTHPKHAVIVTNDGNFHKESKLSELRKRDLPGEILRPAAAVTLICKVTGASPEEIEKV